MLLLIPVRTELDPNRWKLVQQSQWLIEAHKDLPLWQLNKAEVEKHVTHWRNRPNNKEGKRCSDARSKQMIA